MGKFRTAKRRHGEISGKSTALRTLPPLATMAIAIYGNDIHHHSLPARTLDPTAYSESGLHYRPQEVCLLGALPPVAETGICVAPPTHSVNRRAKARLVFNTCAGSSGGRKLLTILELVVPSFSGVLRGLRSPQNA